jgi:hypothetical protein
MRRRIPRNRWWSCRRERRVGKELGELQKKVDEYREREKRRKPTKFKLEE